MISNADSSSPPWDWPYYEYESPLERWIKFDRETLKDQMLSLLNPVLGALAGLILVACFLSGSKASATAWGVALLVTAAALGLYWLRKRMDDYAYLDCDTRCIYTVSYGLGSRQRKFCTFDEVHCLAVKPQVTSRFGDKAKSSYSLVNYRLHWTFDLVFITKDGRELVVTAWPEMQTLEHNNKITYGGPSGKA